MQPPLHFSRLRTLAIAGAAALALAAAAPGTAGAAAVSESSGALVYTTARDEANKVTVAPWGLALKVTETGTTATRTKAINLTAGTGCWQVSSSTAACSAAVTRLTADLGDGDDSFDAGLATQAATVRGGAGNDVLKGGLGADSLDGGAGNDSIDARDAAVDAIACGDGNDTGSADALDTIAADCEAVLRPATNTIAPTIDPTVAPVTDPGAPSDPTVRTTDPGQTPSPSTDPRPSTSPAANSVPATIPPQTVGVSASGIASVQVVCPADSGGCSGIVTLELPPAAPVKRNNSHAKLTAARARGRRARLKIGRAKFTAAAGTAPVVLVRLSKRGRQRILRGRRGRCRITVTTRKADGTTSIATQEATIRPRPAKHKASRR
jgi:hypothetical protein